MLRLPSCIAWSLIVYSLLWFVVWNQNPLLEASHEKCSTAFLSQTVYGSDLSARIDVASSCIHIGVSRLHTSMQGQITTR